MSQSNQPFPEITPEELERNESESQGLIGLQPGQRFDPVEESRLAWEKYKAEHGIVTTPAGE